MKSLLGGVPAGADDGGVAWDDGVSVVLDGLDVALPDGLACSVGVVCCDGVPCAVWLVPGCSVHAAPKSSSAASRAAAL